MKRNTTLVILIILIAIGLVGFGIFVLSSGTGSADEYETETVQRGNLSRTVETNGVVHTNQSALLFWKISGKVAEVFVEPGEQVHKGETLAILDMTSLPPYIITTQVELLNARKALGDLKNTSTQRAQALKAVEEAQEALDDSRHPEALQAQALLAVAEATEEVEQAQRNYEILTTPVTQSAIDQAYANLLLAENKVEVTEDRLSFLENYVVLPGKAGAFVPDWMKENIKRGIRRAIKGIELQLVQERLALDKSRSRYEALLEPPDPLEVASVEAELATQKARLESAETEWERVKNGFSSTEIAVLEAQLNDAKREWIRVKDGPDPDDITRLEAQIAAAEAAIQQIKIVAPFDGTVTVVKSKSNDLVNPGTLAFQLDDLSSLQVDLSISEIDINRIELGQPVQISFDSVPAKEYVGEVMDIALVGTEVSGATNFLVRVEILEPDSVIKPGMSAAVNIVVSEIEDVLLIPGRAIHSLGGDIVVYRMEADQNLDSGSRIPLLQDDAINTQIRPVVITLGASNSTYTEVVDGDLQLGDIVVLNPPSK